MVDIEKLSGLTESSAKTESSGGINIMDAIKGVTSLIKEAKGLQREVEGKPESQSIKIQKTPEPKNITPSVQVVQAKPKLVMPSIATQVADDVSQEGRVSEYFEKIPQILDMAVLVYGNCTIEEFKVHISNDKPKIMMLIKGLM